jgi:hypothetical protein
MLTKKVLLTQNSANAYEESFANAKLLGGGHMKDIQVLHKGKVYQGQVGYDHEELMEITLQEAGAFAEGDSALCFDFKRKQNMRILHYSNKKLIMSPADAEVFNIEARPKKVYEELFGEEQTAVPSYKLNTFATINDDFKTTAVRITDISQLGIGFEINDFSVKMHHVYDSMIICDEECIHPKLIVRYAHILERTIRYGAELHFISSKDLSKLRYYIVTQQFKQLMLV